MSIEAGLTEDHSLLGPLGMALKKHRTTLQISQVEIARQLKMHRTYYSLIERGLKKVRIDTLDRICNVLNVRMWQLLQELDR